MKTKLNHLLALFLFIGISIGASSHEGHDQHQDPVYQAEMLWMNQGVMPMLGNLEQNGTLTAEEFSMFIYHNREKLVRSKMGYFEMVNKLKSEEKTLTDLKNYLNISKLEVKELFNSFKPKLQASPELRARILEAMSTNTAQAVQAATACDNAGFEDPTTPFNHWVAYLGVACYHQNKVTNYTCYNFVLTSYASASSVNRVVIEDTAGTYDPIVGGTALPKICPLNGSTRSLRIENYKNGYGASQVSYRFIVDGSQPEFNYYYAVVLEDPGISHPDSAKPYFSVSIYDNTTSSYITCAGYEVFANPESDEHFKSFKQIRNTNFFWKNWTEAIIPLNDYVTHDLTITFTASDCPWGGHLGYAYIDADCSNSSFTIGPCKPDGTRDLTAPAKYKEYHWKGRDVLSDNSKQVVTVNGGGPFRCRLTAESTCEYTRILSPGTCPQPPDTVCSVSFNGPITVGPCGGTTNLYDINFQLNLVDLPDHARIVITNGKIHQTYLAPFTNPHSFSMKNLYADGQQHTIKAYVFVDDFIAWEYAECFDTLNYTAPATCLIMSEMPCENCIGSFAPTPGEKYIIGAWVREPSASPTDTTYVNPVIEISYPGTPHPIVTATASGKIIDGWQRVYKEFTIPGPTPGPPATQLEVKLKSLSGESDFDDIRIFPADGNMKSYVYDPASLRLVASLDENNYATFYEYDQEGNLTRVKKETERGIVTVSENRQSNKKQ